MIKTIIAYVIVFFLAPIISGLFSFLFLPLLILTEKIEGKIDRKIWLWYLDLFRLITYTITGFVAILIGKIIFSWLGKSPTLLIIVMLGIGFILNDFRRILHSSKAIVRGELLGGFGHLLGIIIGGIYFL